MVKKRFTVPRVVSAVICGLMLPFVIGFVYQSIRDIPFSRTESQLQEVIAANPGVFTNVTVDRIRTGGGRTIGIGLDGPATTADARLRMAKALHAKGLDGVLIQIRIQGTFEELLWYTPDSLIDAARGPDSEPRTGEY